MSFKSVCSCEWHPIVLVVTLTLSPPIPLRLYTLPYRLSNPPFIIFDIRALWRSGLSVRAPNVKNYPG